MFKENYKRNSVDCYSKIKMANLCFSRIEQIIMVEKSQTFSGDLSKKSGEIFFRYFFSKNQRKVMPVSAKADPTPWRALAKNSIL